MARAGEGEAARSVRRVPEVVLGAPEVIGHAEEGTSLTAQREVNGGRFLATQTVGSAGGDLVVVLGWASKLGGR